MNRSTGLMSLLPNDKTRRSIVTDDARCRISRNRTKERPRLMGKKRTNQRSGTQRIS